MSSLLSAERKILIMLLYTLIVSFTIAGAFLFSVFHENTFIYLTLKFFLLSLVPLFILYKLDAFYARYQNGDNFVLSHLEWLTAHYIIYFGLFLLNHWLLSPLLKFMEIDFNPFFLAVLLWILFCYFRGFNLTLNGKNAPVSRFNQYIKKLKQLLAK